MEPNSLIHFTDEEMEAQGGKVPCELYVGGGGLRARLSPMQGTFPHTLPSGLAALGEAASPSTLWKGGRAWTDARTE